VEAELTALKPRLAETLGRTKLASSVVLCHLDGAAEVTRRKIKGQQDGGAGGWSAVATRGAGGRKTAVDEPSGANTGGGRKLLGLKKKRTLADGQDKKPWGALGTDVKC
jgi:transcriptional repressor NF-X1